MFVIIGAVAISYAVSSLSLLRFSIAAAIGAFTFLGTYVCLKSIVLSQSIIFDNQLQKLTVSQQTVFGKKLTEHSFDRIDDIALLDDDDGGYAVGVKLKDGSWLNLNCYMTNIGVGEMREQVLQIRDFLGFPED